MQKTNNAALNFKNMNTAQKEIVEREKQKVEYKEKFDDKYQLARDMLHYEKDTMKNINRRN